MRSIRRVVRRPSRRRSLSAATTAAIVGLSMLGVAVGWSPGAAGTTTTELRPDLAMMRPTDFTIDWNTLPGHRLLRYSAIIVNIGAGPFEITGERPDTGSSMSVSQTIYKNDGTTTTVSLPNATMFYAGDGHNHWHLGSLETGTLTRLDNGSQVGTLAKHGFCFFDNVAHALSLSGAPQNAYYTETNTSAPGTNSDACDLYGPNDLLVMAGLSVGWGDDYRYTTNYQWIDVTNLQNGHYRLTDGVNTGLGLVESNTANDSTYADISLRHNSVGLLDYGPAY